MSKGWLTQILTHVLRQTLNLKQRLNHSRKMMRNHLLKRTDLLNHWESFGLNQRLMSNHLTNLKLNLILLVQTAKVNVTLRLIHSQTEKLNLMLKLSLMLTLNHDQNLTEIQINYSNCFQMKTLNLSALLKLMLRLILKLMSNQTER
mgnify:CR=1 FL=1